MTKQDYLNDIQIVKRDIETDRITSEGIDSTIALVDDWKNPLMVGFDKMAHILTTYDFKLPERLEAIEALKGVWWVGKGLPEGRERIQYIKEHKKETLEALEKVRGFVNEYYKGVR